MTEAVIVAALRTPVGRAHHGSLRNVRPDDLAAAVIRALMERFPEIPRDEVDDVILGCALPHGGQQINVARAAALRAGLPDSVPGVTVNRVCASGLEAIAIGAERIRTGAARIVIAGGTESMSLAKSEYWSEVYRTMGIAAERLRSRYSISRLEQDAFALRSHKKAVAAQNGGRLSDEIVPVVVEENVIESGRTQTYRFWFSKDEMPVDDVSIDDLLKVRPSFQEGGTVTPANSSQTGDGAAAVLMMSSRAARRLRVKPLARFLSYATAGVPPDIMGIGPAVAIPKAITLAGLKLTEIELVELNETFAAESLCVIREANLDDSLVNVNGGAIALGNPLGCTGAKLAVTLVHELGRSLGRIGLVATSVSDGQGAAGILERV